MVDHTFLFTGAVKKMRQLIDDGELGTLYYYDSTRVNLGLFQHDVSVIWDLAPHDLRRTCARLCHLAGGELEQIQFLLGHASVQTTERYLGCKQKLSQAVNDNIGLELEGP